MSRIASLRGAAALLRRTRRTESSPAVQEPATGPASGHELKYWLKRGLDKGTYIYDNYLQLFGLEKGDLGGKAVADFGSGPFGGVLSVLDEDIEAFPIDVLADEYNELGVSRFTIYPVIDYRTPLADQRCDVCFSTNALDHDPEPERLVAEIARILKPGGVAYIHVHQRREDQLNKAHRYVVTPDIVRSWFAPHFVESSLELGQDWPNDEHGYTMIYGRFDRADE